MKQSLWRILLNIGRKHCGHAKTFFDPRIGTFHFQPNVGWKVWVELGRERIELVIGSDGTFPEKSALESVNVLLENWSSCRATVMNYVADKLTSPEWMLEPNLPSPDQLTVGSVEFLWESDPSTCLMQFRKDDDERIWHVTLDGLRPIDFAFDH